VYAAKNQVAYKIEGRWNESMFLIDCKSGDREEVWKKAPYPEDCDYMYAMNFHQL